jgi:tetratricopeptide (TPR) repeat protein
MIRHSGIRGLIAGALAIALTAAAAPAFAQAMGSVRGKIVDEAGKPVPEAEVILEYTGEVSITVTLKTNTRGDFTRSGLRTGVWKLQASKGTLIGRNNSVKVNISDMTTLEPLVIKLPAATSTTDTSAMSKEEVAARNKLMETMKAEFEAGVALIDTDPAAAVAKFTAVAEKIPSCGLCYTRVGDAQLKAKNEPAAEAAYLKAIEVDPKAPEAYSALASLYNQQKKFGDAAKMSAKANELQAVGGTGGNAADVLNQGIIHWNAGQYPEAKAQFEQATKIDPKLADAFYRLGMANVNLGQLPAAVTAFEEYLRLAPTGEHAEISKGILKSIKGTPAHVM